MAKFLPSAALEKASGRAGSVVFKTGVMRPFLALIASPRQPRTQAQLANRASLRALAFAWNWTLNQTPQRDSWVAFANVAAHDRQDVFGQTYYLTGLGCFVSANQNLHLIGVDMIPLAPPTWTVGDPLGCSAVITTAPHHLTVDYLAAPGPHDHILVAAAQPLNPGRLYKGKLCRIQDKFVYTDTHPYDVTVPYERHFGPLQSGQSITVMLWYIDDISGKASAKYLDTGLVP